MYLTKAYCLNENYIFPKCHKCNKSLTPYSITSEKLNKLDLNFIKMFLHCELLIINAIENDKHIIFICNQCFDIKNK